MSRFRTAVAAASGAGRRLGPRGDSNTAPPAQRQGGTFGTSSHRPNQGMPPNRQSSGFRTARGNVNQGTGRAMPPIQGRAGETPQRPRGHQSRFNRRR